MTAEVVELGDLRDVLGMARMGIAVLPLHHVMPDGACSCGRDCKSAGKHPRTEHGYLDATTDEKKIVAWARQYPGCNWGARCGIESKILVVDVDARRGGLESWQKLWEDREQCPTWIVTTGSGDKSFHAYFVVAKAYRSMSTGFGPGIEIKAEGSQVVIPPSRTKHQYAWQAHPTEYPIADIPAWLEALLMPAAPQIQKVKQKTDVSDFGLLGAAFDHAGWIKASVPGKLFVRCPWEHEHSTGAGTVSSTVLFPATTRLGKFHCSHATCAGRTAEAVLEALGEHGEAGAAMFPESDDWKHELRWMPKSNVLQQIEFNASLILRQSPEWKGVLRWNDLAYQIECTRTPPCGRGGKTWTEDDDEFAHIWLQKAWGLRLRKHEISSVIRMIAHENAYHPIQDYLRSLKWDGIPRIDMWMLQHLRAVMTPALPIISRKWLIAMVARAMVPGCKQDVCLILEGLQGAGKSTLCEVLAVRRDWVANSIGGVDMGSKDSMQALQGRWIVELQELAGMKKAEVETIKAYISSSTDSYRPAYARAVQHIPRTCVLIGSTNATAYLHDSTGNRRFWPVRARELDAKGLIENRDQLFAEAVLAYEAGEPWHLDSAQEALLAAEVSSRTLPDPWIPKVRGAVTGTTPVTVADVLSSLGVTTERQDIGSMMRVVRILESLGMKQADGKWSR